MDIDMKSLEAYAQVRPLTPAKWKEAVGEADKEVQGLIKEPVKKHYTSKHEGEMPGWLRYGMLIILFFIAAFAFYVSAGKQLLATATVLTPVANDVNAHSIIDPSWAHTASYLVLGLGELGTIFFLAAATILPAGYITIKNRQINFYGVIFRGMGILSAMVAIIANVTVAGWHWQETSLAALYTIMVTITPPITVLAVGLAIERIILMDLEHHAAAVKEYNRDVDLYNLIQRDPKQHKDYQKVLHRNILRSLNKTGKNQTLLDANRTLRAWAIYREIQEHAEEFDLSVFTQPPQPTPVTAALNDSQKSLQIESQIDSNAPLEITPQFEASNQEQVSLNTSQEPSQLPLLS